MNLGGVRASDVTVFPRILMGVGKEMVELLSSTPQVW
jgi:hypothetical protein